MGWSRLDDSLKTVIKVVFLVINGYDCKMLQLYAPQSSFRLFKRFVLIRSSPEGFLLMGCCSDRLRWLEGVIDALDRNCICVRVYAEIKSDTYTSERVRTTERLWSLSLLLC